MFWPVRAGYRPPPTRAVMFFSTHELMGLGQFRRMDEFPHRFASIVKRMFSARSAEQVWLLGPPCRGLIAPLQRRCGIDAVDQDLPGGRLIDRQAATMSSFPRGADVAIDPPARRLD